ncbi:MAG TPA: hypothetical protein VI299_10905 [Polyangiales bacterium]
MRIAIPALCASVLLACSHKAADKPSPRLDAGVTVAALAAPDAAVDAGSASFLGTVRGIVKLAPGATLPIAPPVLSHGAKPPSIAPCPPVDENDQRVVSQSKQTGGLSPIHVALTGMRAVPSREPMAHELFIDACRLRPTLLGVRKGDQVKVTNRSEMALIPQLPGDRFMRGLMRGETQSFEATRVQTRVQCSFGSYCGETLVIATTHPLYDVTTPEGFFTIEHVPLDQEVTVHAWHPLFEEVSATVTLSARTPEQSVELLLKPAPQKPAQAAEPQPSGAEMPSKSRVVVRKPKN